MTRRRAQQQDGPSLFDELDELDVAEAPFDAPVTIRSHGIFRAAEPQRRARAERPAPPVQDEVTVILERARAERERLDAAITAARHRIDRGDDRP